MGAANFIRHADTTQRCRAVQSPGRCAWKLTVMENSFAPARCCRAQQAVRLRPQWQLLFQTTHCGVYAFETLRPSADPEVAICTYQGLARTLYTSNAPEADACQL